MQQLYQIKQTLLQEHPDVSHYRYDLVNTLTRGNVTSAFSTRCTPPKKLVQRCTKLNAVWTLTKPVNQVPAIIASW